MKRLLLLLLMLLLWIPAAGAENAVRWIHGGNADRVHLRAEPSREADSLGLYYTGTDVILINSTGDWAWVMIGDVTGYVMADYLTDDAPLQCGPRMQVDNPHSTWVNLRMSPSMDGMVAMCPDNGTAVQLLGETADGWSYVECEGVQGYIVTELIGEAYNEATPSTTVLGRTADWYYIHQYTAPNGQNIYFTATEDKAYVTFCDVNFDGVEDIVVDAIHGASNFFSEFFVYERTSGEYVRVTNDGAEERFCNYQLYPEYGLVATQSNNGNAGLLHVMNLYRWDDTELKLIRSAVSDEWSEERFEGQTYTRIIHGDILHVTVRDHTKDHDESILWEIIIPKEDTEYRDVFTEEMEALWQGIR